MSKAKLCLLAVLAVLPVQLSKFFFPNYSYVIGIPIDYRAISVYVIDIIVVAYLLIFIFENAKKLKAILGVQKNYTITLIAFNLYLFINAIFFSQSTPASLVFTVKIALFSMLSVFASHQLSDKKLFKTAVFVLAASASWQLILAFLQITFEKTVGLWFLGERSFSSTTTSIAHTNILGIQYLRPYGTFPHPNVMGAFFAIIAIITLFYIQKSSLLGRNLLSKKLQLVNNKTLNQLLIVVPILGVMISFSRSALLALAVAALIYFKRPKYFFIAAVAVAALAFFAIHFSPDTQIPSIAERLTLIQASFNIATLNPIFGIGPNNFILALSRLDLTSLADTRLLQPVHNVFLLILTENGLIGLLLFAGVLITVSRNINNNLKLSLFLALLIFASVDHFLWTLEQGQLLFFLTLAIINTKNSTKV